MKALRKHAAFTFVELLIILSVVACLATVLLPALERRNRRTGCGISCVNNLKQIGLAFKLWSGDNNGNGKYPMQVSVTNGGTMEMANRGIVFVNFLVMSNELSTPKVLFCPQETDPARKLAATFDQTISPAVSSQVVPFASDNNVSYFIGLDADDGLLSSRPLCGDWNLAIGGVPVKHGLYEVRTNTPLSWVGARHGNQGNIGLADGSVQEVNASGLQSLLIQTGVATNRLAIP
jgi:prepilin-type processing-associated H-X9-DG protein